MRPIAKSHVISSILGLLLALAGSLCANAQVAWHDSHQIDNADTDGSIDGGRLPAAISPCPLGSPQSSDAGRVVQALYNAPDASGETIDARAGLQRPATDLPSGIHDESRTTVPRDEKGDKTLRPNSKTGSPSKSRMQGGLSLLWATGGALTLVLGLFLLVAWGFRRAAPGAALSLPTEAVEILGRTSLGDRQQAQLIRVGRRLLFVCPTADGARTLTEITDPVEVDELVDLCRPSRHGGVFHRGTQARSLEGRHA